MNTFLRTFVDTSNFPIIQAVLAHLFVFTYFSIIQNFKIILSFFHNRNESMMFVHPITHDAHGLALKKMCLGTSSRSIFIVWKRSFLYDKKALCRECSQSTGPRIPILLASLTAAPARTYCRSLEWRFRNPRRSRR